MGRGELRCQFFCFSLFKFRYGELSGFGINVCFLLMPVHLCSEYCQRQGGPVILHKVPNFLAMYHTAQYASRSRLLDKIILLGFPAKKFPAFYVG